jgi:glycine/D-amino acid oxidase-like deaminating enzyme
MTRALTDSEARQLGGEREWHMIPADPMGTTVRRIAENRILIRNGCLYRPSLEACDSHIEAASRAHDRSFLARFPMLDSVSMEYRWGGRLCLSLNSVPAFGEVDEGVYSANCQNGLGAAKGTLSGVAVAELAAGERTHRVEAMLAFAPPRRLPPEPLMSLGAAAKLKWMEWRAGREM